MAGARHLYVHLPFCAPRCGYCDFVTVVGRDGEHATVRRRAAARSSSSSASCSRRRSRRSSSAAARRPSPSPRALERLLAALPPAAEVTVEANPETVTPELAALLARNRRQPRVARRAELPHAPSGRARSRCRPDDVRRAVHRLRDAGIDNISLDLIYGIPGQEPADLARDLAEALALEPEHLSAYELEAKPGTRFTHAHGAELERQAESMESLLRAGRRDADRRRLPLVRDGELLPRPGAGSRAAISAPATTSATGSATTTSASAWARSAQSRTGAGGTRPSLPRYLAALAARRAAAARARGAAATTVRETERVMLGLRLDEPLRSPACEDASTRPSSSGSSGSASRARRTAR